MKQKDSNRLAAGDAPLQPRKKKLVTTPRSRVPKAQMNFRIDAKGAALIAARASALHMSKTELIVGAIERCLHDDVWRRGQRSGTKHGQSPNPPPQLVELSNVLLEMAFVLNLMLTRKKTQALKDQAGRIYLDAVLRLEQAREELGC